MNKLTSFLLNGLLLSLLVSMMILPAVSMGVANIAPSKATVLSEQDVKPVPQKVKVVRKVTVPTPQTTESTETQLER